MRINAICNTSYPTKLNTFGSYRREVTKRKLFKEALSHRNDTSFFRDNRLWTNLTGLLENKFKNAQKVNVYSYGCSEGSEAYTFVMSILAKLEDKKEKYLPVIAKDFDPHVIDLAKKRGQYFLTNTEIATINENARSFYNRFFQEICPNFAYVSDELYDNVRFSVADINKDYKNIEPENSVVFVRNFWPYLKDDNARIGLLNKLYNQLAPGSLMIIGLFDRVGTDYAINEMIEKVGFRPTSVEYVYEKIEVDKVK